MENRENGHGVGHRVGDWINTVFRRGMNGVSPSREKWQHRGVRGRRVNGGPHAVRVKGNVGRGDVAERAGANRERRETECPVGGCGEIYEKRSRAHIQREVVDLIPTIGGSIAVIIGPEQVHDGTGGPSGQWDGHRFPSGCAVNRFDGCPASSGARQAPINPVPWNFFGVGTAPFRQRIDKIQIGRGPGAVVTQCRHQQRVAIPGRTSLEVTRTA